MTDRVCVGMIGGAFGVTGEVRLKSYTADPEAIADYVPLTTEDGTTSFELQLTRAIKQGFAARLSGVRTKEDADALKGTRLYVDRARLPEPEEGEYYHADLIGLPVHDTGGALIGTVKAVVETGAADLLELHVPGSPKTVLLPFTQAIVPTVDLAAGRIVADPPEGLIDG